ncbi:MAG: ATP-grasp domain-containing protein [Eubacteriaceae bacterium]|nr:ATP-grasp domain-containing protein [Eubacteriaceae bacterium]
MKKSDVLRVAIACNIKTDRSTDAEAEFDEPETIEAISAALRNCGVETIILEATEGFPHKLETASPGLVFNITEGRSGRSREAQIPAILEYYGIPYTGSDAAALSVALDKAMTKRIVQSCGVETPAFFVIQDQGPELSCDLPFPVLVKPNSEGSSKGIPDDCVAEDMPRLLELVDQLAQDCAGSLLLEQYIDGREFTVGIIGNGPDIRVFEPMEIIYHKLRGQYKVYSFEVKKNYRDYISYKCPPDLSLELIAKMKRDAETVFKTLGCLDFARVDFRLSEDGRIFFIEINPLPGLAPGYSDFPMMAEYNGINYDDLICAMLRCAIKRYGIVL